MMLNLLSIWAGLQVISGMIIASGMVYDATIGKKKREEIQIIRKFSKKS